MTKKDWDKMKEYIMSEYNDKRLISQEEAETTIRIMESLFPCITCKHNDGTPNSFCYNCE